ncbi:MAG: hypothetical protein ACRDNZ_12080, partial [Streptosporangiaceae bacterium]
VQGTGAVGPPPPLRPRFRRPAHRGPIALWLLAAVAGGAAMAVGAAAGLWFAPFAVGLGAGLVSRVGSWRARVLAPAVAVMAIAGWGIPLWSQAWHGWPSGGAVRVIAAMVGLSGSAVGLPGSATGRVLVTLLAAGLQALAGLWLGRTLTHPRRGHVPAAEMPDAELTDGGRGSDGGRTLDGEFDTGRDTGPADGLVLLLTMRK